MIQPTHTGHRGQNYKYYFYLSENDATRVVGEFSQNVQKFVLSEHNSYFLSSFIRNYICKQFYDALQIPHTPQNHNIELD